MGRQLPWKVDPSNQAKKTNSPSSSGRSPAPPHRPAKSSEQTTPKPRRSLGLSARSPSTSPPSEPLKEEFMIEGVDHDDKYRMVEDEFLTIAGDFTRHLHAAEYQRLKNLAKSENAETIQNISRPVTGEMTDLVKRRHAALDTAARQRKGLASVLGKRAPSEDDRATSLRGLMDSPRKKAVPLSSLGSFTGTRSFREGSPLRRRPKGESESEYDDLDGTSSFIPSKPHTRYPLTSSGSTFLPPAKSRIRTNPASGSTRPSAGAVVKSEDNDDDPFSRMRSRREEQKRRRESNKIKTSESERTSLNEIPFMQ